MESGRSSRSCFTLALLLLVGGPAVAGDAPDGEHPPEGLPVARTVASLTNTLEALREKPADPGHDDAVEDVWKSTLKSRVPRALRRVREIARDSKWSETPDGKAVQQLEPKAWASFTRALASLHTGLGECADGLRHERVNPDRAIAAWIHDHPGPLLQGRPASEPSLQSVENTIALLVAQNQSVPTYLVTERDRLKRQVEDELAALWEEARQRYAREKEAAVQAIEQSVAVTRARLEQAAKALTDRQRELRQLMAEAQRVEEERLQARVALLDDVAARARAADLLQQMAQGRKKALAFSDSRWSRYGRELAQRWSVVRVKLLGMLGHAEEAADEPEAEAPDTDEADADAPDEGDDPDGPGPDDEGRNGDGP